MKIAATCFVVCWAIFFMAAMLWNEKDMPIYIRIPGLVGLHGGIASATAFAVCAIWSIP